MSTPTTPQAALARHHAALADRAEALARQFQVLTQLLNSTDPESPDYPRRLNLLLRLHKVLQAFDPPAEGPPETTPAEAPKSSRTEPAARNPEHPDRTISAPETGSLPSIQNPKSKIQNENLPDVRQPFREKLAS